MASAQQTPGITKEMRDKCRLDIWEALTMYADRIPTQADTLMRPAYFESAINEFTKYQKVCEKATDEYVNLYRNNARRMVDLMIGWREKGITSDQKLIDVFWDSLALPSLELGTHGTDDDHNDDDDHDQDYKHSSGTSSNVTDAQYNWREGKTMAEIMEYAMKNDDPFLRKDVCFFIGSKSIAIEAHRHLLSLLSPILEWTLFESPMISHLQKDKGAIRPCIIMPNTTASAFWMLMRYIYCRTAEIPPRLPLKQLVDFWKLAHSLEIPILAEQVSKKIIDEVMSLDNFATILNCAVSIHDFQRIQPVVDFAVANAPCAFYGGQFLNLSSKSMRCILQRDDLSSLNELSIFHAVTWWAENRIRQRRMVEEDNITGRDLRRELGPDLFLIRFPLMAKEDFTDYVKEHHMGLLKVIEEIEVLEKYWKLTTVEKTETRTVGPFSAKPRKTIVRVPGDDNQDAVDADQGVDATNPGCSKAMSPPDSTIGTAKEEEYTNKQSLPQLICFETLPPNDDDDDDDDDDDGQFSNRMGPKCRRMMSPSSPNANKKEHAIPHDKQSYDDGRFEDDDDDEEEEEDDNCS